VPLGGRSSRSVARSFQYVNSTDLLSAKRNRGLLYNDLVSLFFYFCLFYFILFYFILFYYNSWNYFNLASKLCSSLNTSGSFNSKAKFHNCSPTVLPFLYLASPSHCASPLPIRSRVNKGHFTIQEEGCHTASPTYMLHYARC